MDMFEDACSRWSREREEAVASGLLSDPIRLRMMNDQIMMLERVFILPKGLPGRPETRHSLFSPSKFNSYGKIGLDDDDGRSRIQL